MRPIVCLLTDFGTSDHYVGVMKAVIAGRVPEVQLIDISHEVPAQSIAAAQHLLAASWPFLPEGAVYLIVVDPGVGTSRRAIAARGHDRFFVAPDNGVLTPVLDEAGWEAVEIAPALYRTPSPSTTFHGRDIFAPAAAALAAGAALTDLGQRLSDPVLQPLPQVSAGPDGTIVGEILYVDHFGNLISNIACGAARGQANFRGVTYPVRTTYGAAAEGEALALVSSDGHLEIAVRNGNAGRAFGAAVGEPLDWRPA